MEGQALEGYLLDTNVASAATYEGSARRDAVRDWLNTIGDAPVFVSAVTLGEFAQGEARVRILHPDESGIFPASLLKSYAVLPIGKDAAEVWGQIRAEIFAKHAPNIFRRNMKGRSVANLPGGATDSQLGIQENDLWIVSVAIAHNLVFVTSDQASGMGRIVDAANYRGRTHFLP